MEILTLTAEEVELIKKSRREKVRAEKVDELKGLNIKIRY